MSNPNTFINGYSANIVEFVRLIQALRTQNDQIVQDPSLITRYFDQEAMTSGPGTLTPRNDISEQDVQNAKSAIEQMLFAFDSGAPTQKSYLYKMVP